MAALVQFSLLIRGTLGLHVVTESSGSDEGFQCSPVIFRVYDEQKYRIPRHNLALFLQRDLTGVGKQKGKRHPSRDPPGAWVIQFTWLGSLYCKHSIGDCTAICEASSTLYFQVQCQQNQEDYQVPS